MELKTREYEALQDIWSTQQHAPCPYCWKRASMRKLAEKGLVVADASRGEGFYLITPEGRARMEGAK